MDFFKLKLFFSCNLGEIEHAVLVNWFKEVFFRLLGEIKKIYPLFLQLMACHCKLDGVLWGKNTNYICSNETYSTDNHSTWTPSVSRWRSLLTARCKSLLCCSFLTSKHLIYQCKSNPSFRGYEEASCQCLPRADKNMYVLTKLSLGQSVMTASITVKPHFSTGIAEWLKCGPEVIWDIPQFKKSLSLIRLLRVLER